MSTLATPAPRRCLRNRYQITLNWRAAWCSWLADLYQVHVIQPKAMERAVHAGLRFLSGKVEHFLRDFLVPPNFTADEIGLPWDIFERL